MNRALVVRLAVAATMVVAPTLFQGGLFALTPPPVASAVPFVASNPTSPHTSWSGNQVTLKGTFASPALGTDTFTWTWTPGDTTPGCSGTVDTSYNVNDATGGDNPFVIQCAHTYTGSVGSVFTAVLVVTDTTTGAVSPSSNCPPSITQGACYYTSLNAPPPNLAVEVNNAIDNGLWFVHRTMIHQTSGFGAQTGTWQGTGANDDVNGSGDSGPDALYCTAFEVSGFQTTNTPTNPYAADVQLCLNKVFDEMTSRGVGSISPLGFATFNTDSNLNGIGVEHNGGSTNYQTGMEMDTIAASGTLSATVPSNTLLGSMVTGIPGSGTGGAYTFKDAVIDAVDDYSYCQNLGSGPSSWGGAGSPTGGWHYTCQDLTGDNSVSQWAAIGIIPARRTLGTDPLNPEVLAMNQNWLASSFFQASTNNGYFGYTSNSPLWGPFAVTPSGLVQLAMNGKGRGTTVGGSNMWDSAETYMRDNFGNDPSFGSTDSLKAYYYGMFSFTKSMLLHDNSGTGLGNTPITLLQSLDDPGSCAAPGVPVTSPGSGTGPCYPPINWYDAQTSTFGGTDPTNGVARTILGDQQTDGSWSGQNYVTQQNYFQTAISIIMLNKTVFQPVPVACFTTNPTHVASGGPVTLNGNCSVEQNPANHLVTWEWDISGTGGTNFTVQPGSPQCLTPSCSKMIADFTLPVGGTLPYNYPVRLRVIDSATPALTADVVGNVVIANPPNPPNANAGGPYNFCPNTTVAGAPIYAPFLVDGSKSTNPDQGQTDNSTGGLPPSTITSYLWDFSCSGTFTSASGEQVDVTSAFNVPANYGSSFNVCLQVTNNDNLAFPTAGLSAGLSSVASAQVSIHNPTDEACSHCVQNLGAKVQAPTASVPGNVQLYWTDTNSAQFAIDHYNIYRSTNAGFNPFVQVAGASSSPFTAAVKVAGTVGALDYFQDTKVSANTTYFYRVAPATANDTETCQGNVTLSVTVPALPVRGQTPPR